MWKGKATDNSTNTRYKYGKDMRSQSMATLLLLSSLVLSLVVFEGMLVGT